ncbi:MAG: hypothetical protein UZ12_BCD005003113 [Bacteroidetes bacterium OLB12]|nr:MAG: hypothetical protein UZ12_BCD005003113 [Bacteroidetes bacterium OLB12]
MIVSATPEDASRLNQLVNSAYRGDSSRQAGLPKPTCWMERVRMRTPLLPFFKHQERAC